MVPNILYFHPHLGKIPSLTSTFFKWVGCNHQHPSCLADLMWEATSPSSFTLPLIAGLKVQMDPQHFLFESQPDFFGSVVLLLMVQNSGDHQLRFGSVNDICKRIIFLCHGATKRKHRFDFSYFYPPLELHEHLGTSQYHGTGIR